MSMTGDNYGPQHTGSGDINNEGVQIFGPGASEIQEAGTVVQLPTAPVHTGEGDQNIGPDPDPDAA